MKRPIFFKYFISFTPTGVEHGALKPYSGTKSSTSRKSNGHFSWFPITTYIDNIGAGYMAETGQCNKRTKHIHIEYHFVKEKIRDKVHVLERVASEFNVSDIFTKPLPSATFKRMRKSIMQYD